MKYKVGDRVKIREDLIVGKEYDDNEFVEEMVPWGGQVATIAHCGKYGYSLEGDDNWYWSDEMFEGLASEVSNDTVNHPAHYTQGKIECIDFIEDKRLGYHLGNACKYIVRCQLKNGGKNRIEDLKKAAWYIDRQIKLWEAENE
jgi:hypothetical protein